MKSNWTSKFERTINDFYRHVESIIDYLIYLSLLTFKEWDNWDVMYIEVRSIKSLVDNMSWQPNLNGDEAQKVINLSDFQVSYQILNEL